MNSVKYLEYENTDNISDPAFGVCDKCYFSEEAEDNQVKIDEEDEDVPIEEAEEEVKNVKQSLKNVDMNELDEKEALAKELDDEFFQEWVSILAKEPEQVIRYHRGIDSCVLPFELPAAGDQPNQVCDPGQCSNCGADREFELVR